MNNIIQIVFYAGAVQGIILSIGLFSIRSNKTSNHILALLAGIWGVILLVFASSSNGLFENHPHLLLVFDQLFFLIFPLFYLYAKYLLTDETKYQRTDLWHFLPFGISILAHLNFFLENGEEKYLLILNPSTYIRILQISSDEIISLQSVYYSFLTLQLIKTYKQGIQDYLSSIDKGKINLLQVGIYFILIAWIIGILGLNLELFGVEIGFDYFLVSYLSLVFVIYFISYFSIRRPELFKLEISEIYKNKGLKAFDLNILISKPHVNLKSILAEENSQSNMENNTRWLKINADLMEYMDQDKPFLDPELNLSDLASQLHITRNDLSYLINTFHQKNFYEFVNEHRVEEVKRLMKESDHDNAKMLTYGFEAGFNSKASFYRVFKKFTKMTPREYLEILSQESQKK